METDLLIALGAILGLGGAALTVLAVVVPRVQRRRRADPARVAAAAAALGLAAGVDRRVGEPAATGAWRGWPVAVTWEAERDPRSGVLVKVTRVRVEGGARWPGGLALEARRPPPFGLEGATPLGDEGFDAAVAVRGDPLVLRAAFDAATRARWRALVGDARAVLAGGHATATLEGHVFDPLALEGALDRLVGAAEPLALVGEDRVARLVARVEAADDPPNRRHALRLLLEREAGHPGVRRLLRQAAEDADPGVRALAASRVAWSDAEALGELLGDAAVGGEGDRLEDELVAFAVRGLAAEGRRDALIAVVGRRLADPVRLKAAPETARAVVDAVGAAGLREVVGAAARAAPELPEEPARRLAASLARLGSGAAVEEALLALLGRREDAVAAAAARALGEVGTREAVLPLQRRAEGLLQSRELRRAAEQAVDAIQARLGSPEGGRLALAGEGVEGALSLGQGGEVALAEDGGGPAGGPGRG